MRMWNVPTKMMCRQHLLGEHLEMHMFANSIIKGKNINGYLNGLVDKRFIRYRHAQLVREMMKRGYKHDSPIPKFEINSPYGFVNVYANVIELKGKCEKCKERYMKKIQPLLIEMHRWGLR